MSRLIILVSGLMLVYNLLLFIYHKLRKDHNETKYWWAQPIMFLIAALIIVIIIYYVERKMNANKDNYERFTKENYNPMPNYMRMDADNNSCSSALPLNPASYKGPLYGYNYGSDNGIIKEDYTVSGNTYLPQYMQNLPPPKSTLPYRGQKPETSYLNFPNADRFCDKEVSLDFAQGANNQNYMSDNQRLVIQGESKMNERTRIKPVVVPPPLDPEWFRDNLYVRSNINEDSPMDYVQSGYMVQHREKGLLPGEYEEIPTCVNHQQQDNPVVVKYNIIEPPDNAPMIVEPYHKQTRQTQLNPRNFREPWLAQQSGEDFGNLLKNFGEPTTSVEQFSEKIEVAPNEGKVLTYPNYDPSQLQNYIPSNASVGPIQRSGILDEFNKNLITQTLQPGLYSRNDIIEPVSSNIGISFTQQLEPRTLSSDPNGGMIYERHDGRIYQPQPPQKTKGCSAPDDVYDPRQSGYGTAYRAYVDPRFGAPKFYYDDVDDVRRPKFIIRSNVDHLNPDQSRTFFDVDKSFREFSMYQRNDLAERAMEKINSNNYYKRLAPRSRAAPYNFKN